MDSSKRQFPKRTGISSSFNMLYTFLQSLIFNLADISISICFLTLISFFKFLSSSLFFISLQLLGVYSSLVQWQSIFGDLRFSYRSSELPLWYAHYDGRPSFSDFKPFAGWEKPHAKQYSDSGNKCSASYDINWKP